MVEKLLAIQHRLNPLHVYCRLLDKGLGKKPSMYMCRSYEIVIFVWIKLIIKTLIYFCHVIDRDLKALK